MSDEAAFDPEDEWQTVVETEVEGVTRTLVWQGWQGHFEKFSPDFPIPPDWFIDEDGGVWREAEPETCDIEQFHIPRGHPGAAIGWYYCTQCGAQGVAPELRDFRGVAMSDK